MVVQFVDAIPLLWFWDQILQLGYGVSQMCKDWKTGCGSQHSHQSQYSDLS
uniref:Uncharacterized protein n=1 Tax=Helianthus annuus TaxID=4232 RepID=A0A251SHR2_HELAN